MTPLYMLDTNMVSYIVRGHSQAARAKLLDFRKNTCLSAITEGEIRYGLKIRPDATALRDLMENFLASFNILDWGSREAIAYGDVRAKLRHAGKTIEAMDLMIASHAVAAGAILVSRDQAFQHVSDLHGVEDWATDLL